MCEDYKMLPPDVEIPVGQSIELIETLYDEPIKSHQLVVTGEEAVLHEGNSRFLAIPIHLLGVDGLSDVYISSRCLYNPRAPFGFYVANDEREVVGTIGFERNHYVGGVLLVESFDL